MKKKNKRKSYLSYYNPNTYDFGGSFKKAIGSFSADALGESLGGAANGIAGLVGGAASNYISNGLQSTAGDILNTISNVGAVIPGPLGVAINGGGKVVGGAVNALLGKKVDQNKLDAANQQINQFNNYQGDAEELDDVQDVGPMTSIANPFKGGLFKKNWAKSSFDALKKQLSQAYNFALRSQQNNIENIQNTQTGNLLRTSYAKGGPLGNMYDGEEDRPNTLDIYQPYNEGTMLRDNQGNLLEAVITAPYKYDITYYSPWDKQWYGIGYGGKPVAVSNPGKYIVNNAEDFSKLKQLQAKNDDASGWYDISDKLQKGLMGLMLGAAGSTIPWNEVGNTLGNVAGSTSQALKPGGFFWTGPTGNAVRRMGEGLLMGEVVNKGINAYSNGEYNDVGDLLTAAVDNYAGTNLRGNPIADFVAEGLNPGYYYSGPVGKGLDWLGNNLYKAEEPVLGYLDKTVTHVGNKVKRAVKPINEYFTGRDRIQKAQKWNETKKGLLEKQQEELFRGYENLLNDEFLPSLYKGEQQSVVPKGMVYGNFEWPVFGQNQILKGSIPENYTTLSGTSNVPQIELLLIRDASKGRTAYRNFQSGKWGVSYNAGDKRLIGTPYTTATDNTQITRSADSGNAKELKELMTDNIKYIENLLPGSKAFGSSKSVSNGAITLVPKDMEVMMTEDALNAYKARYPEVNIGPLNSNGTAKYTLDSKAGEHGVVDINVLSVDAEGYGNKRAMSVYQQYFPREYQNTVKLISEGKITPKNNYDFPMLDMDGKPMTAQKLLNAYDGETSTILDSFLADYSVDRKAKHLARSIEYFAGDRPDLVHKALQQYSNMLAGGDGRLLPELTFGTEAENAELLKSIGFKGDIKNISKSPEKMKNVLDAWYLTEGGVFGRAAQPGNQNEGNVADWSKTIRNFSKWLFTGEGGTASGFGQNWAAGADSGARRQLKAYLQPYIDGLDEGMSAKDAINTVKRAMLHPDYKLTKNEADLMNSIYSKYGITADIKKGDNGKDVIRKVPSSGKDVYEANNEIAKNLGLNFATGDRYGYHDGGSPYYTGSMRDMNINYGGQYHKSWSKDILGVTRYDGSGAFESSRPWIDRMNTYGIHPREVSYGELQKSLSLFANGDYPLSKDYMTPDNFFNKAYDNQMSYDANKILSRKLYEMHKHLDKTHLRHQHAVKVAGISVGTFGSLYGIGNYLARKGTEFRKLVEAGVIDYSGNVLDENYYNTSVSGEMKEYIKDVRKNIEEFEKEFNEYWYKKQKAHIGFSGTSGTQGAYTGSVLNNSHSLGGNLFPDGGVINGGKVPPKNYYSIMDKAAKENYKEWGFDTPDAAFTYAINDPTYNYREFYSENPNALNNAKTHWPDDYKTVYHPTFSNESKYSGKKNRDYNPKGILGGYWTKNPSLKGYFNEMFIPSWEQMMDKYKVEYKEGGPLNTHGGIWSNGLTFINNGGSHEESPFGGVPIGIGQDGRPNLVEEGEVIWNDYVFSDRLKAPKSLIEQLKLGTKKDITFADLAKKAQKESSERPNDPISKRGLEDTMIKLIASQEEVRQRGQELEDMRNLLIQQGMAAFGGPVTYVSKGSRKHAKGGKLGTLYAGPGSRSNSLVPYIRFNPYSTLDVEPEAPEIKRLSLTNAMFNDQLRKQSTLSDQAIEIDKRRAIGNRGSSWGNSWETSLRYAPVIGSAFGVFSDLMGWTNKPDYSNANMILDYAKNNIRDVEPALISDYMSYRPVDRLIAANGQGLISNATNRNIMNTSSGNSGAARASLIANGYNSALADARNLIAGEEANWGRYKDTIGHNANINKANADAIMKSQLAGQENSKLMIDAAYRAAALRDGIDRATSAAKSANLTNLFNNLGDIGWEAVNRNMINSNPAFYYGINRRGNIGYRAANGGYLTIKRKKRRK